MEPSLAFAMIILTLGGKTMLKCSNATFRISMWQLENSSNDDVLQSWLVKNKVSRNKAARVPSVINTRPLPQQRPSSSSQQSHNQSRAQHYLALYDWMGNCRRKYSLFENAVIWTSSKAWLQKLGQSRPNWAQYEKTWNVEHLMPYQTMAFLGQKYYWPIMQQPSSSYWVIHGPHPPRLGWQQPCLRMLQMLKCSTVPCRVVTQCDAVSRDE